MPRITLELIRKRSEHNEGEISTLEEISLHQEHIERIELLDRVCKDLRILLLQYNLISRIENLGRLKRLEYLNLALNNIEVIENLEGLESLRKLDLTVNFIGDLRGVKKLRCNEHLEELILTGNPCTGYEGYREYVVATLTQLKELDMRPIERSERIKALQVYARVEGEVIRGYREYQKTREAQINRHRESSQAQIVECENEEEENERFWSQTSYHTPEDRVAIAQRFLRNEEKRNEKPGENRKEKSYQPKLFGPDGRPYNVNQAKLSFHLNDEDDPDHVFLDVGIYKYLDTSYVDVDVQPNYIRVTVKGKVLQLTLPSEVSVEKSTAKRNVTNGNLLVTMPRLHPSNVIGKAINGNGKPSGRDRIVTVKRAQTTTREYLEIGPRTEDFDFSNILRRAPADNFSKPGRDSGDEGAALRNWRDNPDVPALE